MAFYLFEYPIFATRKVGQMGIEAPFEEKDERDIHDRCYLRAFEVEIDRRSPVITMQAYSMSHALVMASRIQIYCDETVTVRLAK